MSITPEGKAAARVRHWSFYDLATGQFTGRRGGGDLAWMQANTPAGCGAVEGEHRHQCARVNLSTGEVEAWQAPAPPADDFTTWAWNEAAGSWVPRPTPLALARAARTQRARLLAESDWVVARAAETGQPVPAEWAAYRQALRDVPAQPGFPGSIDWPAVPA